jgi:hypothetical protein
VFFLYFWRHVHWPYSTTAFLLPLSNTNRLTVVFTELRYVTFLTTMFLRTSVYLFLHLCLFLFLFVVIHLVSKTAEFIN